MAQKACGSSPGLVKSDTVLPIAHHLWDISLKKAQLPGNNKLVTRCGVIQPVQSKLDSIFDIILGKDSTDCFAIVLHKICSDASLEGCWCKQLVSKVF